MRRLDVQRRLPQSLFAGTPFLTGIAVRNGKSRIAAFSLEIEDLTAGGKPVDRRCFFLKIPAHRQQETSYRRTLPTRGIHRLAGLRLSTRFPFGLLRRSLDVEAPAELLVYPALVPVPEVELRAAVAELGERQSPSRARSGDFHGLRELRAGDDPRDIHWRTSARRGRPFMREFEEETGRSVLIVLPTAVDEHATEAFELAVSYAASVALLLLRRDFRVGLVAGGTFIAPDAATASAILRCLALVEATTPDPQAASARPRQWHGNTLTVVAAPGQPRIELGSGTGMRRSA